MGTGNYDQTVVYTMEPFLPAQRHLYDGIVVSDVALATKVFRNGKQVTYVTSNDPAVVIESALSSCTAASRLYLGAHGSAQKFADRSPQELADALHALGLRAAKRIVLAGCNSGTLGKSYAKEFHRVLRERYEIRTEVVGYDAPMTKFVMTDAIRTHFANQPQVRAAWEAAAGKTRYKEDGKMKFLRNSKGEMEGFMVKWVISWNGDQQKEDFVG